MFRISICVLVAYLAGDVKRSVWLHAVWPAASILMMLGKVVLLLASEVPVVLKMAFAFLRSNKSYAKTKGASFTDQV